MRKPGAQAFFNNEAGWELAKISPKSAQNQTAKAFWGEALIQDWQAAGLLKPSVLKPVIFTAEQILLTKTLGSLAARDQQSLQRMLKQVLG